MDRSLLADRLAGGDSIEAIARDAGLHPSSVAYWVDKHGLVSAHAGRHGPRGGVERAALERLVAEGLSLRAMAARLDVSYTTIRHWMARYGLATPRARRLADTAAAREAGLQECAGTCPRHGAVTLIRRGADGFRCPLCRTEAVTARRRLVKQLLVEEQGGACARCGYTASVAALHFHHVDPGAKSFAVAGHGVSRALASARAEAAKCVLLCANCHAEVEHARQAADTS